MVGLDRGIDRIVEQAKKKLGKNTVVVISPDNGAAVWFGGLNAPLRSGKLTPFEGGVRVPALVLDLSDEGRFVSTGDLGHMVHISDWLPTFLAWANASHLTKGLGLDGMDQSMALKYKSKVIRQM